MILNRTYHVGVQKTTNQIDYVPRPIKNISPPIDSTWYPSARPQQIYRKQGVSSSRPTDQTYTTPPNCDPCANSKKVGMAFKLLGKKDNGQPKIPCCETNGPVGSKRGNVINFSGNAKILTGATNLSRDTHAKYYADYAMYLKSRGNTYTAKSIIHKIPEVNYSKEPTGNKLDSSHYYENNITDSPACKITIYKPSNQPFSTQGSVDGSTYVARAKYLAITKNNASFVEPYGIRTSYQETPLFFAKNKFYNCNLDQTHCQKHTSY